LRAKFNLVFMKKNGEEIHTSDDATIFWSESPNGRWSLSLSGWLQKPRVVVWHVPVEILRCQNWANYSNCSLGIAIGRKWKEG